MACRLGGLKLKTPICNRQVMAWFYAYPFAVRSSLAFYALLLTLVFPYTRRHVLPLFEHPVAPHQAYLPGFDFLRGLAALLVAISHCWWATYPVFAATQYDPAGQFIAYGAKGVPIFATLSGFLIYRAAQGAVGSIEGLRRYVIRRFFRIYPAYALGVLLALAAWQYVAGTNYSATGYFLSDLLMLPVFDWPAGYANPPTWSLYVEVTFYAFMPLALIVLGRSKMVLFCAIGISTMAVADFDGRAFSLWRFFLFGILASEIAEKIPRKFA
jgi:peptidoglycan/LPS O-acetylase OafA/YrhL